MDGRQARAPALQLEAALDLDLQGWNMIDRMPQASSGRRSVGECGR